MKLSCVLGLVSVFATSLIAGDSKLPELAQIKIAAEQGDAAAQCKLGDSYYSRIDFYNAEVWFRKAALQGVGEAQYRLGCLLLMSVSHREGGKAISRKPNPTEAVQWFLKAAYQGDNRAQQALGDRYKEGSGVKQDFVEAYKWYEIAARNKNPGGKIYRDSLILKMTSEQVIEGQRRADDFLKK